VFLFYVLTDTITVLFFNSYHQFSMNSQHTKGFTLIELMVVVAIIAIISAVVFANFGEAKKKSRDAKRITDLAQIQLVIQLYYDRCGQYPDPDGDIPDIKSDVNCPTGVSLRTFTEKIPTPPAGTDAETYRYIVAPDRSKFYLGALLESNNAALNDDIDGTVGVSDIWEGHMQGVMDANDPVYVISEK
jgi:prepilin-type N-terminal cleavage/methylation domain-containing protein